MRQRGRKSAESMAVTAVTLEQKRPAPPGSLNEAEAATWVGVTSCYPPGHFRRDTWALLESYCHHCHHAHVLDMEIGRCDPDWLRSDEGLARYKSLLSMRETESRAITALARSMRLTQQAQYGPRKAATLADSPTRTPPWEFRAGS